MAKNGGVYDDGKGGFRVVFYDWRGARRERRCPAGKWTRRMADQLWRDLTVQAQDVRAGRACPAESKTLNAYADEHFFPAVETELEESTSRWLHAVYDSHIRRSKLGKTPMARLTPDVVQPWLNGLRRVPVQLPLGERPPARVIGKLSPAMVRKVEAVLTRVVRRAALVDGYFGDVKQETWVKPWSGVRLPKVPEVERPSVQGDAGFGAVLAAALAESNPDVALETAACVVLALCAGHRRSEAGQMRREAVRVVRGEADPSPEVHVRLFGERVDDETGERVATKNKRDRFAILRGEPARIVARWLARSAELVPDSPWLFPVGRDVKARGRVVVVAADRKRKVMTEDRWARISARAGLPAGFRFHDLRGSFAVEAARRGVDVRAVQKAMGHSSIRTTLGYFERASRDYAERVGDVFESVRALCADGTCGTCERCREAAE